MESSPLEHKVRRLMEPGNLTRDGMLGEDKRTIDEIIAADLDTVECLGLTNHEIAAKLREVMNAARQGLGDPVLIDMQLEAIAFEAQGLISCPFEHPGHYLKCLVTLKRTDTGQELLWTDLSIHMIEAHGFYEGKGSKFRVEPDHAAAVLGLRPHYGRPAHPR